MEGTAEEQQQQQQQQQQPAITEPSTVAPVPVPTDETTKTEQPAGISLLQSLLQEQDEDETGDKGKGKKKKKKKKAKTGRQKELVNIDLIELRKYLMRNFLYRNVWQKQLKISLFHPKN